ncbi:hypothetical protein SUGI_1021430 [Cryptomeria japonica]|uniref:F-box/kelch-repeat protein At3g27150 n=1 Tax=Cryptomeria japonica TaxID=3369 RepID=UPI002414A0F8|nr:F-box/kelch-repeat protein At3g27150 [Cryptomeria japonica]GLJ48383.1 hypothetical protein SUGI_1021430 [Cryptomeria japonica]
MAANPNPDINPSLFLLPNSSISPSNLECMQIDLISGQKTKIVFTNPSVNENIFLKEHACVSHGSLVLILGGRSPANGVATDSVHIFNTETKEWLRGPNMMVKRSRFAWGVIGNRLYIAGGFGGSASGYLKETDVYDFETKELWAVSEMPVSMVIDIFFVYLGKLFVRGWVRDGGAKDPLKYFSYCPVKNAWQKDSWLRKALKKFPPMTLNKFAVTKDNEIYMVEQSPDVPRVTKRKPSFLIVSNLDKHSLKWKRVYGMLDSEVPRHCKCAVDKEVRFLVLGKGVIVLMHDAYPDEGEITPLIPEITEVSVLCPSTWAAAIVNA